MAYFSHSEHNPRQAFRTLPQTGILLVPVAVEDATPLTLLTTLPHAAELRALPFAPFDPGRTDTLEEAVGVWTGGGPLEQLITRYQDNALVVGYLCPVPSPQTFALRGTWRSWYDFLPWEDRRGGVPEILSARILPALKNWASLAHRYDECEHRQVRIEQCFGSGGVPWDEEKALDRYELLDEAGLLKDEGAGESLPYRQRRFLAAGITCLRRQIKTRPVIFDLMPASFTLFALQKTLEAVSGTRLHKQNFRRQLEQSGLVEETGRTSAKTGGRPASLYRFRRDVLRERADPGIRLTRAGGAL